MPEKIRLTIFTDGGARGNPGSAGIGAVIKDEQGRLLAFVSRYIGRATNNQAEYQAVLAAMEEAQRFSPAAIDFFLDSELVARQLSGAYKVKNRELAPLFVKVHNAGLSCPKIVYHHVPREQNREADKLVNQAIDQALK